MSDIDVKLTLRADSSGLTGQISRATAAVSETERALKSSSTQADNFERSTASASQSAAKQAATVGELAREHRQATSAMQQSQKMQQRQGTLASAFARGIQVQKGALSQLSYQLQDVAVQSQMGTDRLIILGQQGPQILSLLGPLGAVAGVGVAVAAAMGGIGLAASGSSSQIQSLAEALDALNSSFEDNSNGAETLSSDIVKLADDSAAAARLKIQTQIDAAKKTLTTARNELGTNFAQIVDVGHLSALEKLDGVSVYDKIADSMKISVEDVQLLADAFPDVTDKFNPAAYEQLIIAVGTLRDKYGDTSPALNEFSAFIAESGLQAKQAADKLQLAQQAMADFDAAIELAKTDSLQTDITPEMKERNWLAEYLAEQEAGQRKVNENAQQQLAIIETQNQALRTGATVQEAQAIAQDEQLRLQLQQAGVSDEFVAKLLDARKTQRELTAQTKNDNNSATANAQAQLAAIVAKNEALSGGATLQQAQVAAQESQLRAQLQSAGVADGLIDSIIAAQRAQQTLVAAQKDQGVITQLKQQYALHQKNSKEMFIQSELAKLSADATDKHKKAVREIAGELYDQTEGQRAADAMQQDFERAMQSVAQSLTDALISGDWDATGEQIGAALGTAIGSMWGPVGGAIGGIIGNALGESMFAGSAEYTGAEDRAEDNAKLFGNISEKSDVISDATARSASSLDALVGINREIISQQRAATEAQDKLGISVGDTLAGIEDPGKYLSFDNFRLLNPEDFGLQRTNEEDVFTQGWNGDQQSFADGIKKRALDDLGLILSGSIDDIAVQSFQDLDGRIFAREEAGLTELFQEALDRGTDLLAGLGDALGFTVDDIQQAIAGVDPSALGELGTDGMDAVERAEIANAAINQLLINAAETLPGVSDLFADVSDDAMTALSRTSDSIFEVTNALDGINGSLGNLSALQLGQTSEDLVNIFGGGGEFSSAIEGIFDAFASDEQKAERNLQQLTDEFAKLDLTIPQSSQGLLDLVASLDLTSEAGTNALESISRSRSALVDFFQTTEASVSSLTDTAFSELTTSVSQRLTDISSQLAAEREALQEQRSAAVEAARLSAESARTRVRSIESEVRDIENAYDRLAQEAGVGLDRDAAFNQLQLAASDGDLTDIGAALAASQNINAEGFTTAEDYAREQRKFLAVLEKVEDKSQGQLSAAEQQLNAANRQISAIEDNFDEQIMILEEAAEEEQKRLEALLEEQQSQINELRGIDQSVQSVDDSIKALQAALVAELSSRSNATVLQTGDMTVLGWGRPDGSHAAGLTRVPFDGYRAELHRDEMVLTADVANAVRRSVGASNNSDMAVEVARLRAELADLKSLIRSIAASSSATANTLEDIEVTGLSIRDAG